MNRESSNSCLISKFNYLFALQFTIYYLRFRFFRLRFLFSLSAFRCRLFSCSLFSVSLRLVFPRGFRFRFRFGFRFGFGLAFDQSIRLRKFSRFRLKLRPLCAFAGCRRYCFRRLAADSEARISSGVDAVILRDSLDFFVNFFVGNFDVFQLGDFFQQHRAAHVSFGLPAAFAHKPSGQNPSRPCSNPCRAAAISCAKLFKRLRA